MFSVTGCTTNYLYTSAGLLKYSSGEENRSILYWRGDEGWTWYLAPYNELDSGLVLRTCNNASNKDFIPDENTDNNFLVTLSRSMDYKVAEIDEDGNIVELDDSVLLKPGSVCGKIMVSNNQAEIESLVVNGVPEVVLLCSNKTRPGRYPVVGKYIFGSIAKTESKSVDDVPSPCVAPTSINTM